MNIPQMQKFRRVEIRLGKGLRLSECFKSDGLDGYPGKYKANFVIDNVSNQYLEL